MYRKLPNATFLQGPYIFYTSGFGMGTLPKKAGYGYGPLRYDSVEPVPNPEASPPNPLSQLRFRVYGLKGLGFRAYRV